MNTTVIDSKSSRTIMVPVTTMEEMPLLDDTERAELIASLKESEARIATGDYVVHDPNTFVERLLAIRSVAIHHKST